MDVIQRGYYAGVDPGNMLQGFSKISAAMDIIKLQGLDAAKTFAPLLVMADQASMAGESAGNAYRKIFQATLNNKKIDKANDVLAGTGIKLSFQNSKGQFAGLENLYKQLDKLNKITDDGKKQAVKATLFGDDAETLQALNIMITKGIAGYRETAAKLENQATLRERVEASLNTLGNKWEAAGGSFTNAMASIGETVAPVLKNIADWLGDLASALDGFVKRHPQLTAALFKIAAVFAIVATAAGVLSLALASILGPMAIVRVSAGVLGLKFTSVFVLITKVISGTGQAILWLGRLMMANPILAIIGLIAMGAIYIWQNWETLGPKFKALWDAISSGVSGAWAVIKQTISNKWDEILNDVAALPAKFKAVGGAIIDGILSGINEKWETLKSKLASVKSYLPDWMTGGDKSPGATQQKGAGGFFAGMYDSGGYIPRGQVGIAGENGPELINGPAYVTSRRRTAALASIVAGMMGGAMPAEAAPLHPMSLPAASYRPAAEKPAGTQPVFLPDWMTGGDKSPGATQQKGAGGFFAGMYDSGGYIPRGQVGIAGENGPELINGPAYVTSRRRTAALASIVAGMMGGAMPAEAAPLHPMSLPAASYRPAAEKPAGTQPVFQFETQAQIIIQAQPGQSPQDIAREVARQLDERERRMRAKARSSFSDQGGYDS